jgi:chromosome partitioning protein
MATRRVCWASDKGGSGKTTTVVNVAWNLARMKKSVLVVDADPQANATLVLLRGEAPEAPTLYHVLTNTADAGDTIRTTAIPGLDLMPGDGLLADANLSLASEIGRERRLRLAMRGVDDAYDFVVIDTSPSRTLININVLNYVSEVWTPVDPGVFSLAGLVKLQGAIAEVVKFLDNPSLRLSGLVLTQARGDNLTRDVEAQLRGTFGALVCQTTIPQSVKVGEAHAHYLPVGQFAPRSPAAKAYESLTLELIEHGKANRNAGGAVNEAADADGTAGRTGRKRRAG